MLFAAVSTCLFIGSFAAQAMDLPCMAAPISGTLFAASLIPRGAVGALRLDTPDLSALSTAFVRFGGKIFRKNVNEFDMGSNVTTFRGVKQPEVLTKLSGLTTPRPYRSQDDTTQAAGFTDRTLYVRQSKLDFDLDPERFRQTYLAQQSNNIATEVSYYQFIIEQIGKEYMAAIGQNVAANGVYNPGGTGIADIADGWLTIARREVAGAKLMPVAIGTINAGNAVAKVELFAGAQPNWWRKNGFSIKCTYQVFDAYSANYRTINPFGFNPRADGKFYLDNFGNVTLEPVNFLPAANNGLMGVVQDALVMGTDGDAIQVHASIRRNIIELRLTMPIGFEYSDLDCISVSDLLVV